ncbi:MAG: hypothetical protein M3Y33_19940 [Actinomycetota bacterium]|nr:hypothetical protein [Actinomycetota bacterium]
MATANLARLVFQNTPTSGPGPGHEDLRPIWASPSNVTTFGYPVKTLQARNDGPQES